MDFRCEGFARSRRNWALDDTGGHPASEVMAKLLQVHGWRSLCSDCPQHGLLTSIAQRLLPMSRIMIRKAIVNIISQPERALQPLVFAANERLRS